MVRQVCRKVNVCDDGNNGGCVPNSVCSTNKVSGKVKLHMVLRLNSARLSVIANQLYIETGDFVYYIYYMLRAESF